MSTTQTTEIKNIHVKMIVFGSVGVVFFVCSLLFIVTYALPGNFADAVRNRMFLPLVVVDRNQVISFREVAGNIRAIRQFYENQDFSEVGMRVDFSSDDGKKRLKVREKELVNKMIEDRAIESLARNRDIVISSEMVDQSVQRKLDELGSAGSVLEDLDRLYGWTLDDFKGKVVRSALYEESLNKMFQSDKTTVDQAKLKIDEAETALARGSPFEQVAGDFSDGRTAGDGGRLGWFTLNNLIPELREPVRTARIGAVGPALESPLGFHIVRVDAVNEEDGVKQYQLSQIFAKKPLFSDWLSDQMKRMDVWIFDTEYNWNKETARLEFRDEMMRDFEAELIKNTTGDPAFLLY